MSGSDGAWNRNRFGNSEDGSGKDRAADAAMGVWTYSGGWKMKMQLCAAQLVKADLLMLDEPTGSLREIHSVAFEEFPPSRYSGLI